MDKRISTLSIIFLESIFVLAIFAFSPPTPYSQSASFKVTINNNSEQTSSRQVTLTLKAGSDIKIMALSNTYDFKYSVIGPYQSSKQWTLSSGEGVKQVYAKFYIPGSGFSEVISDSIVYKKAIPVIPNIPVVSSDSSSCPNFSFNNNLYLGLLKQDVQCLKVILNKDPDTALSATGQGSAGRETVYFGPLTKSAVIKFQNKYRNEISQIAGYAIKASGFVGPGTRAQLNALSSKTPASSVPPASALPSETPVETPTPPVFECGNGLCDGTETCSTCSGDCGSCDNFNSLLAGNSFFGMQIENLTLNPDEAVITTTGAKYILKRNEIELWRRIDPKTNTINPKKVGYLKFNSDIGSLSIESADKRTAIIQSEKATFVFNSDSLFFIKAKSSFSYTHTNLIENAPWNKGSDLDRIWTDGYGGSLHAKISGNSVVLFQDINSTKIQMSLGDTISVMVFPAKKFDFERLYGANSRPFVHFSGEDGLTDTNFADLKNNGFGTIVLWNYIYDYSNPGLERTPVLLDSGILGYKIKQSYDLLVKNFVNQAHQNGFKVIVYKYLSAAPEWNYKSGPKQGQHQDIQTTLQWMRGFQQEYRFDGWYFDGADVGSLIEDYDFIRQVRKDIGDNGIIFHHGSVDAWDNDESAWNGQTPLKYTGRKAVMIDNYVDYTVAGETGTIAMTHGPDDPYLRYFSSGYGMSQAYASEIRLTKGKAAISIEEKNRALGQNLNGAERNMNSDWIDYFKPYYDKRKTEYLSRNFNPDADWPPKWFKAPGNIQVKFNSGNSVNIIWDTEENSTGEITYTSDGIWWHNQYVAKGADGIVHQSRELIKHHSVVISNLKNNTFYQFRIRSSNLNVSNELIWGYVGNFTTSSGTQKIKCPAQIPKNCDDNCKNKFLIYWKFDSGDCDYSGDYNFTYYGAGFDGKDSFEFNYNYKDYIEIQKENNPLSDISVYGGENGKSTVMAWVKVRNASKYNVLAQHIGGFDYFSIGTTGGKPVLKTMVYDKANDVNYWPTSKTSIKENEWTHVAFVFEGGIGYKFYINGILDSEIKNSSLGLHNYSTTANIAYLGYGFDVMSYFDGNIKDLTVFNDALTDSEIYSLAN